MNFDEEVWLWIINVECEKIENFVILYSIIVSLEYFEWVYVCDFVLGKE